MKTGFTEEALYTQVATATRDGRRVIVVLLRHPEQGTRASTAAELMDWAFAAHTWPR